MNLSASTDHALAKICFLIGGCILQFSVLQGCAVAANEPAGTQNSKQKSVESPVQQRITAAGHQYWYFPMPDSDRTAVAINWAVDLPDTQGAHVTTPRIGIDLMLNGGAGGREAAEIIADFEDLDACLLYTSPSPRDS